jgi:hypothetical protein
MYNLPNTLVCRSNLTLDTINNSTQGWKNSAGLNMLMQIETNATKSIHHTILCSLALRLINGDAMQVVTVRHDTHL